MRNAIPSTPRYSFTPLRSPSPWLKVALPACNLFEMTTMLFPLILIKRWLQPLLNSISVFLVFSLTLASYPNLALANGNSPLSGLDLAFIISENTSQNLGQLDQHLAMTQKAYGKLGKDIQNAAAMDLDSRQVLGKSLQMLTPHFKTVSVFKNIEDARAQGKDLYLVFDAFFTIGTWPGEKTDVEITGVFMDQEGEELATLQGRGEQTLHEYRKAHSGSNFFKSAFTSILASEMGSPVDPSSFQQKPDDKPYQSYLPGFSMVLNTALGKFENQLNFSKKLRRYAEKKNKAASKSPKQQAPPPEIRLHSPQVTRGEAKVPDLAKIQIKGLAVSSNGIAEVRVRNVPAALIPAEDTDLKESGLEGQGRGVRFIADVLLEPGRNEIEIAATDTQGISSTYKSVIVRSVTQVKEAPDIKPVVQEPEAFYKKNWGVVIGVNHYQFWPSLEYAVNDALAVKKKFLEQGFDEVIEVLDKDATRERILTLLGTELPKKVGTDDRVVIFFAGHGQTESLSEGREQGYIIPVDGDVSNYFATAISMTQVRELSQRIPAKHLLYVMDACYSGQGFNRAGGLDPAIDGYIEKITSMRSVQMITAGGSEEQVMENQGHGIFTQYFLRGLDGEADRDNDKVVTASELGAYLKPQVSRASGNLQTPQYGRLDGEGDVVFIIAPKK